jgi:rhodanese-related sulfurtransferase
MSVDQISAEIIDASKAWELMQSDPGVALIDVRSDMEFLMIGHPKGAVNVPLIDAPDWTINPLFVANVRKALLGRVSAKSSWPNPNDSDARGTNPVLLICRSGNRSMDAAQLLIKEGLSEISVIAGGFEGPLNDQHHRNTVAGWRFEGLPWEQC